MTEQERAKASAEKYQQLRAELDKRINEDTRLSAISEKIRAGTADFRNTSEYSEIVANHIGAVLQENVGTITNPLGKEYVCKELLRDHYDAINDVLGEVQIAIDNELDIHLTPQKAPFPSERVQTAAHALEDPTVKPETIRRRANAPVANVAKSFHDDYIRTNAKLRNDLGLKPIIQRYGTGCCSWCSAVAGKYRFGEQPEDIFRRHDNCNCVIIYDTQVLRGKQTEDGGRSKTWEEVDPSDVVQNPPSTLSQEQAENLQNTALQGLTLAGKRDIINAEEMFRRSDGSHRRIGSEGQKIIDQPTYNRLTKAFKKHGGIIMNDQEAIEHLQKQHAHAEYLPSFNTILTTNEPTISDILEETFHAEQDRIHRFGDVLTEEVRLRREIEAQEYLLSMTEKYKIPLSEVELTKKNLDDYKQELEEYLKFKGGE